MNIKFILLYYTYLIHARVVRHSYLRRDLSFATLSRADLHAPRGDNHVAEALPIRSAHTDTRSRVSERGGVERRSLSALLDAGGLSWSAVTWSRR